MAPNNALGNPSAAKLRAKYEGDDPRLSSADGFGAGDTSVLDKGEVSSRVCSCVSTTSHSLSMSSKGRKQMGMYGARGGAGGGYGGPQPGSIGSRIGNQG